MPNDNSPFADHLAQLDTLIERARRLPSWPDMAAHLERLTQTVAALTARVEALEQECTALRQDALLRFWEQENSLRREG